MGSLGNLLVRLDQDGIRRGRQFELICKWFLTNDPLYQHRVERVWLWNEWPNRWGADAGIDLVVEDRENRLWAIQAKAYDPSYSVTKADVDTFLSESSRPQFSYRLLIATTNRVGTTARRTIAAQEKQASLLLLADLEGAQVDWPSSPAALRPKAPKRKRPRPHQTEAIRGVVKGFDTRDRGQLIMACGTGKTLTALGVARRLRAQRTLVLVPSLSLLAQTMREWTANASSDFDYLPVCSDETVADTDAPVSSTSELGFPVTTDIEDIVRFLRRRSGRRVVFSTYQSSPRIAEAYALGRVPQLDLAVADEAHRCAGSVSSDFATILDAEAIPAKRRLFMTATPRYFTGGLVREAREADFDVASMDDPAVFGPVFHRLSFGEAIERDLLSDYQVAVIGVDDATYRKWAERARFVTIDGTAVTNARLLAGQIGVAKAMRRYDLRRTISFHSRVARARDFASSLTRVVDWMPKRQRPRGPLWARHVSGEMPTGERTLRLEHLRHLDGHAVGLLANARCLAEGVDVPTLDGVVFIDPRRSEVDIVQAVGRAIRKAENRRTGTIVIPVFIGADEDPDAALDDSAFKPVWDVIWALRAHDANLGEQLDSLRRELGRGTSRITAPPKIHLDLPAAVGQAFVSAFYVRLIEQTTSRWESYVGVLEAFVQREGHCEVPTEHVTPSGLKLGAWCNRRRHDRKVGRLSSDRIAALDALGFVWEAHQAVFDRNLSELAEYIQANGHARVPRTHTTASGSNLGSWCLNLRTSRKAGTLSAERIDALDAVGFVWDPFKDAFSRGLAELAEYVEARGDSLVPANHRTASGFRLGGWCVERRVERKDGRLRPDRLAALDALGFAWEPLKDAFDQGRAELAAYVDAHGDALVKATHVTPTGFALGRWCNKCRVAHKRNLLDPKRVSELDALGFAWDPLQDNFDRGLAELAAYVEARGDARVPQKHVAPAGFRLGAWCAAVRTSRKRGRLGTERIAALDAVGFIWTPVEDAFNRGMIELESYVAKAGDARVPQAHVTPAGFHLGRWCSVRRRDRKNGKLSTGRIAALDALGFVWDARQAGTGGARRMRSTRGSEGARA